MILRRAVLIVLATFVSVAPLRFVHAQFDLQYTQANLSIDMVPAHPAPGDTVHLHITDTSSDLAGSVISWKVNGKTLVSSEGATDISVVAGNLGSQTAISVSADTAAGPLSASLSIIPVEVDLLIDSNSYTPPFYEGRALPSPGSSVRAEARVRLISPGGKLVPANQLIYTWRRNGLLVPAASGKGRLSAVFPSPGLFDADTITVTVSTTDGTISGESAIRIASIEPIVVFYEDNPLFGMLYRQALPGNLKVRDSELTVAAMPYFAQAVGPTDQRLSYDWSVNASHVPADSVRPDEITVSAGKSSGLAAISLELTSPSNLSLDSSLQMVAQFSGTASGAAGGNGNGSNPFTKTTTQ